MRIRIKGFLVADDDNSVLLDVETPVGGALMLNRPSMLEDGKERSLTHTETDDLDEALEHFHKLQAARAIARLVEILEWDHT